MTATSIGDLAASFVQRRAGVRIGADLNRLAMQLTTGVRADVGTATSGDIGPVAGIQRGLSALAAYRNAASEAAVFAGATQAGLGRMSAQLADLTTTLVTSQGAGDPASARAKARAAHDTFGSIVGAMNAQAGGRNLFAGAATDGPAVKDADTMLAEIVAAVGGAATAQDIGQAVDDYFSDTGAFVTGAYLGATQDLAIVRLSPEDRADPAVRADDPALRAILAATAKAAILDMGVAAGDLAVRIDLLAQATGGVLDAKDGITGLQAHVGTAERRIELAQTRNAAEESALQMARIDLIGADPYETATRLETTQAQLEALYTVTARLSRLSLTNYL